MPPGNSGRLLPLEFVLHSYAKSLMSRPLFSLFIFATAAFSADVRVTNDSPAAGGYQSVYTIATGIPYTDAVIAECSKARGRQNEPAIAMDPRNVNVILGSSNDYCGVYAGSPDTGPFVSSGPIWLGYYRSENGGATFKSSLVPGYPGDTSPYAKLARIRTASSGDPVIAWDNHGRAFFGSESSDDPAGSKKTFGDAWVATFDNPDGEGGNTLDDGKRFVGSVRVANGSSAPNTLGKFNDKTAIEADRTRGACDGNVYFAWSRFTGNSSNIYFSRSTDHGQTWSAPANLTSNVQNVQDPDIAVTGNGHVYVTFDQGATRNGQTDAVLIAKSSDCGASFAKPVLVSAYTLYEAQDISSPQPVPPVSAHDDPLSSEDPDAAGSFARDCGDFDNACQSGYTFFRRATSPRSTADQKDLSHEWVYILFDASKPGTVQPTGTSYGSVTSGTGSQSGIYFVRLDGRTGAVTAPVLIDDQTKGHQFFPDISADAGVLHAVWWDSRDDPNYSPLRPVGNNEKGVTSASVDAWAAMSSDYGTTWIGKQKLNAVQSNPNYEQFSDRSVPFAGDYLWITSVGTSAFATWTDWRNTVAGPDPRDPASTDQADVKQCRTFDSSKMVWSSDTCPHAGGLDQDIYGSTAP